MLRKKQKWDFFTEDELSCPCCKEQAMDPVFMKKLVDLREMLGFALPVTSAFRCPRHNYRVSETGFLGPHTTGRAVDILICREQAGVLLDAAFARGFKGIGIRQHGHDSGRFIHLDMIDRPWQTVWTYQIKPKQ